MGGSGASEFLPRVLEACRRRTAGGQDPGLACEHDVLPASGLSACWSACTVVLPSVQSVAVATCRCPPALTVPRAAARPPALTAPLPKCRGFITLSASLGQMLVSLHQAVLHSVEREQDTLVLAATLRVLGTLLLGAPYHRLPPQLLPLCVRVLTGCLARATPPAGAPALLQEQLPVVSACLACLAATFSSKDAAAALAEQLVSPAGSTCGGTNSSAEAAANSTGTGSAVPLEQQQQQQALLPLLFDYAACQHPPLQLEALMALRGVAQQHAALLAGCWGRLLALGRSAAALPVPSVPQSPRSQHGEGASSEQALCAALLTCMATQPMLDRCCWLPTRWAAGVAKHAPRQSHPASAHYPCRRRRRHRCREGGPAGRAAAWGLPAGGRGGAAGRQGQCRDGGRWQASSSGAGCGSAEAGSAVAAACRRSAGARCAAQQPPAACGGPGSPRRPVASSLCGAAAAAAAAASWLVQRSSSRGRGLPGAGSSRQGAGSAGSGASAVRAARG